MRNKRFHSVHVALSLEDWLTFKERAKENGYTSGSEMIRAFIKQVVVGAK